MKRILCNSYCIRISSALLSLLVTVLVLCPIAANPQNSHDAVRVGWYESPFNTTDELGRRSGYAYEYQQKIAAYTGWNYEYVTGSWSELMTMLESGEIDLMSDVSYTDARAEKMFFSSLPMGTEEYYIFTASNNTSITQNDYNSLNGKKLGVNYSSIQKDLYKSWAKAHGIKAELIELTTDEDESTKMLLSGEIDAYIGLDTYGNSDIAVPVFKIGLSDFYFSVSNSRPELLNELDIAMNKIQEENKYYNQQLSEKYLKSSGANIYLGNDELNWLSSHGPIRVGYQDNYMAFCAAEKDTGNLTGALKDYLACASDCLKNAHIDFEAISYPTAADAIEAMKNGEIDCVFPANLSEYDAESQGIVITPPLMSTELYAVVRALDQVEFVVKKDVSVAVNKGNPNYEAFLLDHFPGWKALHFDDTPECLRAVALEKADCILISNYRFNNISKLCRKYHLVSITTGVNIDYSLVLNDGNTELYSILSKITNIIPESTAHAALAYYSAEDAKPTFSEFLIENIAVVLILILLVALIFIFLLLRSLRAERKALEEQKLISATEIDNLSGLYNRDFFFEYANQLYTENPEKPMDAIVLNIEQFHSLNTIIGHEFGDHVLSTLGSEIHDYLEEHEGIAGRFDADQFGIYCNHTEDYGALFDRFQNMLDSLLMNASIRLRMGVMPWQEGSEPVKMFECANTACNMQRGHNKRHLTIFNEKIREREIYEQRLLNDLRLAIENKEISVYYQTQYDIQADIPVIRGAEALVRWNHPDFGMIMPSDFIHLFEQNGQIGVLDKYVWSEAIKMIADWRDKYGVILPVSINISRMDIFDTDLVDTLNSLLEEKGLSRDLINLEITESAYTDEHQFIQALEELKQNGYNIEMDDFGVGYSSLSMLSAMPIDMLKMDAAFLKNVENDERSIKLVELIIDIANNLKVPVVAEGVENEQQLQLLKKSGCTYVQGYYLSAPLSASEFENTVIKKMQSK